MSYINLYEKYDIPVPSWRLSSVKKNRSAAFTPPPPLPPLQAPPKKKIVFIQEEVDAILKRHPYDMRVMYKFTRREAEDAAEDSVKDWEALDEQNELFSLDDDVETWKGFDEQNELFGLDNRVETWEELDRQKKLLELVEHAGWVEPNVVLEYDPSTSLEENCVKRDNGKESIEKESYQSSQLANVQVLEANKEVSHQTNAQFEQSIKEAVSIDSSKPLSSNTDSAAQEHLEAETIGSDILNHNPDEESSDFDSLFGDDGEDLVQQDLSQKVVVGGEVVVGTDSFSSFRKTEVALSSAYVRCNGTQDSGSIQQPAGLAEAGLYTPFAAPHIATQPTDRLQARNTEPNSAVSHLPPFETVTRLTPLLRNSRLTFPEIPIQQPIQHTLQHTSQDHNETESQPSSEHIILHQPESRLAFGPSQTHQLTLTPKRGPKPLPALVLTPSMDQRCRKRLEAGVRHIREFVKSKKSSAGAVPQDGNLEWRIYLEKKIWEDEQQTMGSISNAMLRFPHISRGIADDVDAAMSEFLKYAIYAEKANEKNSKASAASATHGPSQSQGGFSRPATHIQTSHCDDGSMAAGSGLYPAGIIAPSPHGQPQLGIFPGQPTSNFAFGNNASPQASPVELKGRWSHSGSRLSDTLQPSSPQMMGTSVARSEPNPGFTTRYTPSPRYAGAALSLQNSQCTNNPLPSFISFPSAFTDAGIPALGFQAPSQQAQQVCALPSNFQQPAQSHLSPRGQAVLHSWELDYFAKQDQLQADVNQTFGHVLDAPNPVMRQQERKLFQNSFYQNAAQFGEAQYIHFLLQTARREDLFGRRPSQQSSGPKRRAGDEEDEQEGRGAKRNRHFE
ncbi:hypothetical protein N431DRAFT_465673 [Stipitochalara longipes BDJ]|nr:hypothetical protein N431DRAFT_465673 [Stipitochalara longipes BDJ]